MISPESYSATFNKILREEIKSGDDFKHPETLRYYNWWDSFPAGRPLRSDFKIEQNWHIAPNLYLIECLGAGKYLYRLNGEEIRNLLDRNQAGTYFSIDGETPELNALANYLEGICTTKRPVRCEGSLSLFSNRTTGFESCDCPLFDEAGEVKFVLGLMMRLK